MAIRIVDESLCGAVGSRFGGRNDGNSLLQGLFVSLFRIPDLKGEMVSAGIGFDIGLPGCSRLIVFQNQVNLLIADLVPVAGKGKVGPGDLVHAEEIDIELAGGFEVFDHERDVIKGLYLDTLRGGSIGHEIAFLLEDC